MFKQILVATDGSAAASRAVDMAADLASKYQAELTVLHVMRKMQVPPDLFRAAQAENVAVERAGVLRHIADRILENAMAQVKPKRVPKAQSKSVEGDPAVAIIAQARQLGVDLIILGTRGLGEVEGMLLGSVSRKVSNLADANIMIVK